MDYAKIKRNVRKMVDGGATGEEIDRYIASEGATLEDIRNAKEQQPSALDNPVVDAAFQAAGPGFNKGLYDLASLPANALNAVLSVAGQVNAGFTGQQPREDSFRFKRPLEAFPEAEKWWLGEDEARQPRSAAGQVGRKVGEYVGADVPLTALTLGAAPAVKVATAGSKSRLAQMVNTAADGVTRAPGAVAAGELASSTAAGVGGGIGQEIGGDTGELIGAIAGGVGLPIAVALAPSNLARKAAVRLKERFDPEKVKTRADAATRRLVRNTLENEGAEAALRETAELQDLIPDYKPSVAEATESPDFIATQRAFEASMSGDDLNKAKRRYTQNEEAIQRAANQLGPDAELSLDTAITDRRSPRLLRDIDAQDQKTLQKQRRLADDLQSGRSRGDVGAELRQELINQRQDTKAQMRIVADEMGLNDANQRFNWANEKGELIASVTPRSKLADQSAIPHNILRDIRKMDDDVSIVDLMELRSRISTDIREAQRTPTGEKKVPYLIRLQEELDLVTDRVISRSDDPELADRLKEFRRIYRDDYIKPFEQGAAGKLLDKSIDGDYKVSDEKVARQYWDSWSESAAKQFNETFKHSPAAKLAMKTAAYDSMYEASVRDGIIQPQLLENWVRKHSNTIAQFPEIRQEIDEIGDVIDRMAKRRATLQARKEAVQKSTLARELARVESGNVAPEQMLNDALRSPARMAKIVTGLRDKRSADAISRHFWDSAMQSGNPTQYLKANEKALRIAMGPEHFTRAQKLARAIDKTKLVPRPAGRAIDTNPMAMVEGVLGTGLNQISSRIFAVKSGRTSSRYAVADIMGRAFRKMSGDAARKALLEALYDPRIAKDFEDLLEFGNLSPAAAKRLHTHLISTGAIYANQGAEDDQN